MKKIVSILCIILLLVATSNLAVNIHFCGGKISSINFFGKSNSCAGNCDSKASINEKKCCTNFATIIHTDDSTTSTSSIQTEQQVLSIVSAIIQYISGSDIKDTLLKGSLTCNAPPDISEQPYYILYRSIII